MGTHERGCWEHNATLRLPTPTPQLQLQLQRFLCGSGSDPIHTVRVELNYQHFTLADNRGRNWKSDATPKRKERADGDESFKRQKNPVPDHYSLSLSPAVRVVDRQAGRRGCWIGNLFSVMYCYHYSSCRGRFFIKAPGFSLAGDLSFGLQPCACICSSENHLSLYKQTDLFNKRAARQMTTRWDQEVRQEN